MKLAGLSSLSTQSVQGSFGSEVGYNLTLDLTQGPHGRAFYAGKTFDLPDPASQPISIQAPQATLEIIGPPVATPSIGSIDVNILKLQGNIKCPVVRAKRMDFRHAWLQANEVTGPQYMGDEEPQTIRDMRLYDSRVSCKGDLNFANLQADDHHDSFVQAKFLEGLTAQGKLYISAERLLIGVLEAQEVRVSDPNGCRIGQIFCDSVLHAQGLTQTQPTKPIRDADLLSYMSSIGSIAAVDGPEDNSPDIGI